jgi:hypothetical protein
MKLTIFEINYDGYDDKQLLVIDNIDILPSKGDSIVIDELNYIVKSFLWLTDSGISVTMYVDYDFRTNGSSKRILERLRK